MLSEMDKRNGLQHFILTRFNLLLWNKDKSGAFVRSKEWLEHRFELFERYCLQSIIGQTCQEFEWIVLFDSKTPSNYKDKIEEYKKHCPQLIPVFVEPAKGRCFAEIFRQEVLKRVQEVQAIQIVQDPSRISELENTSSFPRVLTSYLDNDDALNVRYVEDIQKRALALNDGSFISYTHGYQFFTDYNYMMQVSNQKNHFISVVESGTPILLKTVYGYGSHYYIDKIKGSRIEYVNDFPMWCEVIHEKNMDNDAYFLFGSKMVRDRDYIRNNFSIDQTLNTRGSDYLFRFLPRYIRVFFRRIRYYFFGRHW